MAEKTRQVVYVWNYREWGGVQIYFLSLMKEAKRSYRVTALIPSDSDKKILDYLDALGVSIQYLSPAPHITNSVGFRAKLTRRFALLKSEFRMARDILGRNDIGNTIVHIDLGFWQSFLPLFLLSTRASVFVTVHTGLPFLRGIRGMLWSMKGKILSRFSNFYLLASNMDARRSLAPYTSASKFEQIEVTYAGFDPAEIKRVTEGGRESLEVREKFGIPNGRRVLITVGQFIPRKGCWIILETLKRLRASKHDVVFLWLATSLPDAETINRIDSYGLGDSFRLIGSDEIGETRDDLLNTLCSADIFVLASLQEGLPIALVEAMALGLPCIATSVNAIPEAIVDGQNGRLVPPNDPVHLGEQIEALLDDPTQRKMFGANARATAFEKFSEKVTAERTITLYDAVWKTDR